MSHPRNLFFRSVRVRALMLVLVGAGATCPIAAQIPEYARINFQELTEGDSITDQYAAFGVYFSLADGPGAPIAVAEGSPAVAFTGPDGDDTPIKGLMTCEEGVVDHGLTDPVGDGGDVFAFRPIRITFDPPARGFRFWVHIPDEDGHELPQVRAYYGDPEQSVQSHKDCTGRNGKFTQWADDHEPFTRVELTSSRGSLGFSLGALSVFRDPQPQPVEFFIQVAQESAPGADDFDANVLGLVRPWRSPPLTAPSVCHLYSYGSGGNAVSYGEFQEMLDLQKTRTTLAFLDAREGLTALVVHNRAGQCGCSGEAVDGTAQMRLTFAGDTQGLENTIQDGPHGQEGDIGDQYFFAEDRREFTAQNGWEGCNTDGFGISGLAGDWGVTAAFTDVDGDGSSPPFDPAGVTSWVVASSDGLPLELALEADRRVRLSSVCVGGCEVGCADVASLKARCKSGEVKVKLRLVNALFDGQRVRIRIGETEHVTRIRGDRAKVRSDSGDSGQVPVSLVEPDCPAFDRTARCRE